MLEDNVITAEFKLNAGEKKEEDCESIDFYLEALLDTFFDYIEVLSIVWWCNEKKKLKQMSRGRATVELDLDGPEQSLEIDVVGVASPVVIHSVCLYKQI